jgi:hypothetical protein
MSLVGSRGRPSVWRSCHSKERLIYFNQDILALVSTYYKSLVLMLPDEHPSFSKVKYKASIASNMNGLPAVRFDAVSHLDELTHYSLWSKLLEALEDVFCDFDDGVLFGT